MYSYRRREGSVREGGRERQTEGEGKRGVKRWKTTDNEEGLGVHSFFTKFILFVFLEMYSSSIR